MSKKQTVAEVLWEMLVAAGVKRCYGIVGDAMNPIMDALRGFRRSSSSTCAMRRPVPSRPTPSPS